MARYDFEYEGADEENMEEERKRLLGNRPIIFQEPIKALKRVFLNFFGKKNARGLKIDETEGIGEGQYAKSEYDVIREFDS